MAGLIERLKSNRLARDSFWAVFGNGAGYGLLLLAGIFIARFLGSDVYGEYGLVKTTMIYIAGFATFGLGITGTRYVANALSSESSHVASICRTSVRITLVFSVSIAVIIALLSNPLARFLDAPSLSGALRSLAVIIVLKALNTTQNGLLAGFGDFKQIARNNVFSGLLMLGACIPLTYYWGLMGAFIALGASQALNVVLNAISLRRQLSELTGQERGGSHGRELIFFSFPIAIQEFSYSLCSWGGIAVLTILSDVRQVGIYSAAAQWNGVITFIPGLLNNVILSHLSGTLGDEAKHRNVMKTMLMANFLSSAIPFAIVFALAGIIASFYGPTFGGLTTTMRVLMLTTVFASCSSVFYSELLSAGHNWLLLGYRIVQDVMVVGVAWILLIVFKSQSTQWGAMYYSIGFVVGTIAYFLMLAITYRIFRSRMRIAID